jgi:hypothetical protein
VGPRNLHRAAFFVPRRDEGIQTSNRYEMGPNRSDNGKMDAVLTINMVCAEWDNVIGVASVYGMAKCLGLQNCHHSIDDSGLNMLMCDPNGQAQCGKDISGKEHFRELEFVLSKSNSPLSLP